MKERDMNIVGKDRKNFVDNIFVTVADEIKSPGLVDCTSAEEFNFKLNSLSDEWKKRHRNWEDFLQYFACYKADLIKKHYVC